MYGGVRISAVAAVADNGIIGRDGALPWRLPADLARFKRLTTGHAVLMGRGTWADVGRPLPRRMNVVLSSSMVASGAPPEGPRLRVVDTLEEALEVAARWELRRLDEGSVEDAEIFAIGGPPLWTALWPRLDRLYRTRVHAEVRGDVRFPPVDLRPFELIESRAVADALPTTFEIWQRRRGP